jgi:hypothetical protein
MALGQVYGQGKTSLNLQCVSRISIYPQENDFAVGQQGKVIISTRLGDVDGYHTSYQTEARKIKIKVEIPASQVNTTIYFKVIDPDDASPYEAGTEGNDNYGGVGSLTTNSGTTGASISTSASTVIGDNAIAEVTLNITDRYSGDNYKVIASVSPDFPLGDKTVESINFIAWKRVYFESHAMYERGSFLYTDFTPSNQVQYLRVWDKDNIKTGDNIIIFDRKKQVQTTVLKVTSENNNQYFKIYINPINVSFLANSGVRKVDEDDLVHGIEYDADIIDDAYGKVPNGDDKTTGGEGGGAFVEWQIVPSSYILPRFQWKNPAPPGENMEELNLLFLTYWFDSKCTNCNVFMVAQSANGYELPMVAINYGKTWSNSNITAVYVENIENRFFAGALHSAKNEVLVHEIGHQFSLGSPLPLHIDLNVDTPKDNTQVEVCTMSSYVNALGNSHAEFDAEPNGCIYGIRKSTDPR